MMNDVINIAEKFTKFSSLWDPKILGKFDNYYLKVAKMKGEFVWHSHADVDEVFFIIQGCLKILLKDKEITLNPGECFIVPKGVEHKPVAEDEVHCLLIEKAGTLNTGDVPGEKTVVNEEWI